MNKQKLQEQIDTMREKLAKMETELAECDKVELNGGEWRFTARGIIYRDYIDEDNTQAGITRATKRLAEIASRNMVTRNKLEAYAHQIDPEWRDQGAGNDGFSIYKDKFGKFCVGHYIAARLIGAVYMRKDTAEQICEWLNDGRIEL